jgi:heme/copper-type cytochrome/quinol oxidase subunit 2
MTNFDLTALLLWLGDAFLIIAIVAVCCCYYGRRRRDLEEVNDDRRWHHEAAAASHAQPAPTAAAVQMAAMAVALLNHVTHPRQNVMAAEDCAICLSQFEDGDLCSVMPGCRHEFHRSCIAKWLKACNNTCPLCRAQLQWDVAHDMV